MRIRFLVPTQSRDSCHSAISHGWNFRLEQWPQIEMAILPFQLSQGLAYLLLFATA